MLALRYKGVEFEAPEFGTWYDFPGTHGLVRVCVQRAGEKYYWAAYMWHPFGYWRAMLRTYDPNLKRAHALFAPKVKFSSEQEAIDFLTTAMALSVPKE